jgi:beta-glucosidase-like glycosyl hydrolase/NADPH:quinone reductase-like Zn-dependent oxidoreductase
MKIPLSILCLGLFSFLASVFAATAPTASIDDRVHDLLAQMTLEEKVGQLVQYSARDTLTGPDSLAQLVPLIEAGGVGSMLSVQGVAKTREMQKLAVESSRLHIPLLFAHDVIHGYRTIFPIPLGTAASWDLAAIERAERIAAVEASAAGLHWTFAPMVDIARDPRWGRIAEGAGEDPFLGSAIARARVRGVQTDRLGASGTLLACAKHFAAYGSSQAGRDYFTTDVTERVLRDVYLPPFKAAVDAGVATFMAGFNDLDGTPCTANSFLLDRVLRSEWGFRGLVVSDWHSIGEMIAHGNTSDLRDTSRQSILAGLDVDMESHGYETHLAELVRSGAVPLARLDAAVGSGVDRRLVGQEVIINPSLEWGPNERVQGAGFSILGLPRAGTFAENIVIPAVQLAPKAAYLSWDEAAGLPLAGLTAYRALFSCARLTSADRVLVTGAGGGVALFVLQLAFAAGAKVWVTSSSSQKIERAVSLGAVHGFNYKEPDWVAAAMSEPGSFDVIVDGAGGENLGAIIDLAAPGARIVSYGATCGNGPVLPMRKVFWRQLSLHGTTMGSLMDWQAMLQFTAGHDLRPVVAEVFPFAQFALAFGLMEQGGQFGKIVMRIS